MWDPPSARISAPVRYPASREAAKAITPAICSGSAVPNGARTPP